MPPLRQGFTLIELFMAVVVMAIMASLILPGIAHTLEAARRVSCQNNLGQIALALHNYHAAHRMLPSGCVNETGPVRTGIAGDNHFGWIAQILPQLDEAKVWGQLDFSRTSYDQPAVSLMTMPTILSCPTSATKGNSYAGCHHNAPATIDIDNNGVLFLNSSIRFREISDGKSHTLLAGETLQNALVGRWFQGTDATLCHTGNGIAGPYDTSPTDLSSVTNQVTLESLTSIVPGIPVSQRFGSLHDMGANVALADGAVRFVSVNVDASILRRLGHRRDGEVIGSF